MPREANAVDFWRGFALVSIFVNHIPGICYERLTHRNLSISNSAELFVFLAGWSLGLLVGRSDAQQSLRRRAAFRLGGRAVQIYAAHILISALALALLATTAYLTDNPLILEWHNAAAVFQDPAHVQIGLVLLTHQLGYFDILPLYVVLMLAAPALRADRPLRPAAARAAVARALLRVAHRAVHAHRPGRSKGSGSSIRSRGRRSSCWALPCRATKGWARCAPQHQVDPVCCGARSCSITRGAGVVQLVSRSDQAARAEACCSSTARAS